MFERIFRCVQGYIRIKIYGKSPERFLNLCRYHEIQIWGLYPKDNAYEMYILVRDFKKLHMICRKTHTKVKIIEKYGVPIFIHHNRKRKIFLFSAVLAIFLLIQYSNIIWDIHFIGNEKWTDPLLIEFLEELHVTPGMHKSEFDCSQIASEIRKKYNDIVWVSVSIEGSCLKIHIKENEDTLFQQKQVNTDSLDIYKQLAGLPQDLIATADGIITDMITRQGTPLVQVGDEVKKGDVLVRGRIDVKDDNAQIIEYQYCQADADILADTEQQYHNQIERSYVEKIYFKKQERRKWYLSINGHTLCVGADKNRKNGQKEVYRIEHQLKIGENFYLPITYGYRTLKIYKEIEKKYSDKEIQQLLSADFTKFLQEFEKKGIQIRENSVRIRCYENYASAEGILYLNQSITESADTEILEIERNEINESSGTVN